MLDQSGLAAESFRIIEEEDEAIFDFTISGRIRGLLLFFKALHERNRHFIVENLYFNALEGRGEFRASMRVSYPTIENGTGEPAIPLSVNEILESRIEQAGDWASNGEMAAVARLFIWADEPLVDRPVIATEVKPESEEILIADWLEYLGSITQNDRKFFIFKDTGTNRIYRITGENAPEQDGWLYIRPSAEGHYIRIDEKLYLVPS